MSEVDCSTKSQASEQRNNAQLESDEDDVSSHDGFTTIVSDNDLVQRDVHLHRLKKKMRDQETQNGIGREYDFYHFTL
jgi:hypothetical protein